MAVFIVVALALLALVNYYVARRGSQALAACPKARTVFLVLYILMAISYPAGRILRAGVENMSTVWLDNIGAFHMVIMFYGLLAVVLVDLVRLVNAFAHVLPRAVTVNPGRTGLVLFTAVAAGTLLTVAVGAWNSARPRLVDLEVHLARKAGTADRLNAVLVSDFHLGSIIGSARLRTIVDRINSLEPDIIFIPGDMVDESVTGPQELRLRAVMKTLKSRLGTFVAPGNHETYAGLDRTLACFRNCDMTVLQEQAVRVADAFVLVGRRDQSSLGPGEKRLGIGEILAREGLDDSLPVIVLDHRPARLEEAEKAGVSLQLSGHTHAGQIFPLNVINGWVWELNWGRLRKGGTQYYVTSGVGTWGPPVRTGSWPEIVRIALVFDGPP